ncbi:LuxR C-terminal-related transcriptional regulator [Microbacterium sp. NPDC056234]|uniref:LuxR C-terminal-related transcriptional regulator n=1 Tax=Microbacterium sp. NPDC056234 TaxID=3345757 RepID=UPI0035D921EC
MVTLPSVSARTRGVRFRPPAEQRGHLRRPRLTAQMDTRLAEHPTLLVVAPSGYGKTSAVAEWAAPHQHRVAWLTLGAWDTDRTHLDLSVLRALQGLARETCRADLADLLDIQSDEVEPALAFDIVSEALMQLDESIVLVVDDAHRAQDEIAEGLLGAFIRGECEQLQVIVVGTGYVEIALSRIALTRAGCVLRPRDLAFSREEISSLYEGAAAVVDADAILAETSGWPIALRFVQLSGVRPDSVDGTDEPVLRRYVRDHVVSSLPDDLAAFVLDSSVCRVLTPELAAAISGVADGAALLERCAEMGLFLDRFETGSGPAYRWHGIAARQFRSLLDQTRPTRRGEVLRLAAAHLRDEDPLAAAQYLSDAGDTEAAVRLVSEHWVALAVGSRAHALDSWCATLPREYADDPRVLLMRACAQDVVGNRDVAEMFAARAAARADSVDVEEYAAIRSRADLFLIDDRAELVHSAEVVRTQLAQAEALSPRDRAALLYLLGWSELRHRTAPDLILQLFSSAATEARASGQEALEHRSLGHLAFALAWAGQFVRTDDVLADGVEHRDEPGWSAYAGGSAATASGFVAYWRDDLDRAHADLTRATRGGGSNRSFAGIARMMLAFTAAATRDPYACQHAARELQALPQTMQQGVSWPAFRHAALATLFEASGRREQALKIVAQYEDADDLPLVTVILAGIAERMGRPQLALHMLRRVERYDAISYIRVTRMLVEGVLHWRADRLSQAHDVIEQALELAVAENLRRPFAGGGLDIRQVLTEQLAWGTRHEDFITSCLAPKTVGGSLQVLSEREREVFAQLRTTRTMQEIAAGLGVSINTIKTHQRAIYRKLGVASRREAVRLYA